MYYLLAYPQPDDLILVTSCPTFDSCFDCINSLTNKFNMFKICYIHSPCSDDFFQTCFESDIKAVCYVTIDNEFLNDLRCSNE